jgi:L-ascorbate metabolism protein UlaG (beta-lactamase superfamily)
MKIKKIGHSCMVINEGGLNILTDPGSYTAQAAGELKNINVILISDEHQDHFDLGAIESLLKNNPEAKILTQKSVQKLLAEKGVKSELLLDKQQIEIGGVKFEGCGEKHAVLHSSIPQSDNTGYIISEKFFYPGDALTLPHKNIEVLALPISGPWLKSAEVIDYVLAVKPKFCFPVHDGLGNSGFMAKMIGQIAAKENIKMLDPEQEMEF